MGAVEAGDLLHWCHTAAKHLMLALVPTAAMKTERGARLHSRSDQLGIFSDCILHKDRRLGEEDPISCDLEKLALFACGLDNPQPRSQLTPPPMLKVEMEQNLLIYF